MRFFYRPTGSDQDHLNDPVLRLWKKITAPSYGAFENLTLADLVKNSDADQMFKTAAEGKDELSFVA